MADDAELVRVNGLWVEAAPVGVEVVVVVSFVERVHGFLVAGHFIAEDAIRVVVLLEGVTLREDVFFVDLDGLGFVLGLTVVGDSFRLGLWEGDLGGLSGTRANCRTGGDEGRAPLDESSSWELLARKADGVKPGSKLRGDGGLGSGESGTITRSNGFGECGLGGLFILAHHDNLSRMEKTKKKFIKKLFRI